MGQEPGALARLKLDLLIRIPLVLVLRVGGLLLHDRGGPLLRLALASGPDAFDTYRTLLGSPIGLLILFGLTVAFLYHLANGVRHLFWDAGKGFEPKTADMTGWAVIVFGVVAAVLIWIIAFFNTGAAQ